MGLDFWDEAPLMSNGNFVRHTVFRDIGLDAIHMAGQAAVVVEANFFELASDQPRLLKVGDFPAAIFAETSSDLTIRDNTIIEAMGNCIDLPGVAGAVIQRNFVTSCGQSGIGIFQDYDFAKANSSNIVIRDNVLLNSGIWPGSPWQAGITIAQGRPTKIIIADNIITDMRPKGKKTQDYGIEVVNDPARHIATTVTGLVIEAGNRLEGNQRARTAGVH